MPSPINDKNGIQSRYWVPMLGYAIRILEVFFDSKTELSLHEVSTEARVGKTSTFRILFTLNQLGYIQRNESTGKYRLGLKLLTAAQETLWTDNFLLSARPYLEELRNEVNETANLAALRNGHIVYLEIVESLHPFRMVAAVGSVVPWHSTALGKAIAAYTPPARLQELLKAYRMVGFTKYTVASRRAFISGLAKVRSQGYALDDQETELGATCVAVPILNSSNEAMGAISVSGPTPRVKGKEKKIIRTLQRVVSAIRIPEARLIPGDECHPSPGHSFRGGYMRFGRHPALG